MRHWVGFTNIFNVVTKGGILLALLGSSWAEQYVSNFKVEGKLINTQADTKTQKPTDHHG
jgi:hypothetical protein